MYEIFRSGGIAIRPARRTTPSTCSRSSARAGAGDARAARAPAARVAAVARGRGQCFSWTNRAAIEALPHAHVDKDIHMNTIRIPSRASLAAASSHAHRGCAVARSTPAHRIAPCRSVVTLSASATASVANDRMFAWLRAEADNADPARGRQRSTRGWPRRSRAPRPRRASRCRRPATRRTRSRTRTSRALARAQTLSLEGSDFAALSALVSQLQADDGLVVAA